MKISDFLILTILFLFAGQNIFAQNYANDSTVAIKKSELMHSSTYQTSEMISSDIDMLNNLMKTIPKSKGVFFIFCGKVCKYGEVEAHLLGLNISLRGKGWKKEDYIALNGGFREELTIEYWLLPENAGFPVPNSTVEIKDVKFKGTFKGKFVPYDCCEY
jgi:hypothetical protein